MFDKEEYMQMSLSFLGNDQKMIRCCTGSGIRETLSSTRWKGTLAAAAFAQMSRRDSGFIVRTLADTVPATESALWPEFRAGFDRHVLFSAAMQSSVIVVFTLRWTRMRGAPRSCYTSSGPGKPLWEIPALESVWYSQCLRVLDIELYLTPTFEKIQWHKNVLFYSRLEITVSDMKYNKDNVLWGML